MNRPLVVLVLSTLLGTTAAPVLAQGFGLAKGSEQQIQVYADDGIEWHSEATRVVARGNAKAIRGNVTVTADTLIAYYRNTGGGDEIWRLDAEGNVTIASLKETATGTKATYDLDKAIFVLRGKPAHLVTPSDEFFADDTLEYWEKSRMAVARGNAVAIQKDKKIKSDVLTAHFKDGAKGALEMQRADAYGNVVLTTPREQVTGERGDYNAETGIATVVGSVKIMQQGNELAGGYAHVNLNTGVSKLFGSVPGAKEGERVKGTFTPDKRDPEKSRAVFQAPGATAAGGQER
ncbi:MAG: hypothetical protein HY985_18435 [Magnetospirillum sp.]|nr:hypothetical protein [Magnetospirillum sp.]